MRRSLIWILFIGGCLAGNVVGLAQSDPASEVIRLVNELRASYGLPAYQVDPILMSVAQEQASWSAANNYIGHTGPGGTSPNDRAQAAGYGDGARSFAVENAAHGTASLNSPQLVVAMWQSDWGHLSAMISPDYEHIGVGYAVAGEYSWYVMMVGWVAGDSAEGQAQAAGTAVVVVPPEPFVLSEPDESGAIYHEVRPGQTAWTIAARYGVDLAEFLVLNNLTSDSVLHPGDILLVRPPASPTMTPSLRPTTVGMPAGPVEAPPTSTGSPPPAGPPDTGSALQSWVIPISLAVAAGIVVLVGLELMGKRMDRNRS